MIKAVIFDWGGVLIDDTTEPMRTYLSKQLGVDKDKMVSIYGVYKCLPDFQKGIISEDVFWERTCSQLAIPKPKVNSLWGEAFRHAYSEKKEVFALASTLKKNSYRIGLLSNTEVPAMGFFHEKNYSMFDATVFSCSPEVQSRKPEKEIYEIALNSFFDYPDGFFVRNMNDETIDAYPVEICEDCPY